MPEVPESMIFGPKPVSRPKCTLCVSKLAAGGNILGDAGCAFRVSGVWVPCKKTGQQEHIVTFKDF